MGVISSSTGKSVVTLQSSSPLEDSLVIRDVFPGLFRVDEGHEDDSVVLIDSDGRVTVFLLPSDVSTSAVWVTDDELFRTAAAGEDRYLKLESVGEFTIGKLDLQSGASILLAPHGLLNSYIGRKYALKLLRTPACRLPAGCENASTCEEKNVAETSQMPYSEPECRLPKFPSLQVKLQRRNGVLHPFPLNARAPVDVETELFKGKLLLLIRPPNPEDDPYWNERVFSKKKRRMIVQVQGKFNYRPKGIIYAGAEVSNQMKLGLLSKGLCGVLLRLVESFNSQLHYSYGDSKGDEKPHIAVPAYSFFERVVVTPQGEQPPPIDELFGESSASATSRKRSNGDGIWNTSDTFSFSFYSMYIDLPTWQLVGLPLQGDLSLKTFWGDSMLKICMYEKLGNQAEHYQRSNNYAFAIQVSINNAFLYDSRISRILISLSFLD